MTICRGNYLRLSAEAEASISYNQSAVVTCFESRECSKSALLLAVQASSSSIAFVNKWLC